mmetsp:Transcript_2487/g.5895  ORF Transcript_2487/g.5895 Transcript_2487/m.5895 type:complete len:100 (+) Transcript_2487:98-397(+)
MKVFWTCHPMEGCSPPTGIVRIEVAVSPPPKGGEASDDEIEASGTATADNAVRVHLRVVALRGTPGDGSGVVPQQSSSQPCSGSSRQNSTLRGAGISTP